MLMLALGATNKAIAHEVSLDVKTLKRHYGGLIKDRDSMLSRLRTDLRTAQIQQGLAGNAAALNNAIRSLDAIDAERVAKMLRDKAANQGRAGGYVSKKETRQAAAGVVAGAGRYKVPAPPMLVVNNVSTDDEG
jgi:hypothetical protein